MKTKYSKQNWVTAYKSPSVPGSIWSVWNEHGRICTITDRLEDEMEANAKLIAAAPEMLSILLDLQKYNSMHKEFNDTFAVRLTAAIQKATN